MSSKPCRSARVVIPTWNAGPQLRDLLRSLRDQQPRDLIHEIVVIDSSSSDGTPGVAAGFGARVVSIPKEQFNHGSTRTRAAAGAATDALVFLVQDSIPTGFDFLQKLLEPLEDPAVAATFARVTPRPDATVLVLKDVERDLVAGRARLYKQIDALHPYHSWSASDRRVFCHFNNVASAVRTCIFEQFPFQPLPFGEDLDFGKRVIEAGHAIVYNPDAVVIHSHASGLKRDFARHRDDAIIEKQLFGIARPASLPTAIARAARLTIRDLATKPAVFSPALRLAQSLGRWRGVCAGGWPETSVGK